MLAFPHWYYQDYTIPQQFNFVNLLVDELGVLS